MKGLTENQKKILEFITDYRKVHINPPCFKVISDNTGVYYSAVLYSVKGLKKKGYLGEKECFFKNNPTEKQLKVLNFIKEFIAREGKSPTLAAIGSNFGVSRQASDCYVRTLMKKGYLKKEHYKNRGITVTEAIV